MNALIVNRGASISACERYRYELRRVWDYRLPLMMFVGLNPSTADSLVDDHTCKKWMHFAQLWGYGGFLAYNLFAYRATDPAELVRLVKLGLKLEVLGERNDQFIERAFLDPVVTKIVPCWGASIPKELLYRARDVSTAIVNNPRDLPVECFGFTASGQPKHPLTLGYTTPLVPFHPSVGGGLK